VGTVCLPRYAAVVLTSPDAGTVFGPGAVPLVAELRLNSGRTRNDPASLAYAASLSDGGAASGGTLGKTADGVYGGPWAPAAEGGYQLSASYAAAGLTSAKVEVAVDLTGPAFLVEVPAAPARADGGALAGFDPEPGFELAWRRDEKVTVDVTSLNDDVDPSTVTLKALGYDAGAPGPALAVAQKTLGCLKPYCGTVEVDLSKPELKAFRGIFGLVASGRDRVANAGGGDAGVKVTRWKWAFDVAPAAAPIKTSPAIGTLGTVYFGTVALGSTGTLYALNPDGTVKWAYDAGAIEASPAVGVSDAGAETVFVASTNPTGAAIAALTAGGVLTTACSQAGGSTSNASLAISDTTFALETVVTGVGLINSAGGRITAVRPNASATGDRCRDTPSAGLTTFPATISMDGANAYFGDDNGNVQGFSFISTGWSAKTGWPVTASLFTRGLAIVGTDVVGGGGPGQGGVFRIPASGTSVAWKYPAGVSSPAWSPAVGSGNGIYFGNQTPALTKVLMNATTAVTATPAATVKGAPAIGQDGVIYTADSSGELAAWTGTLGGSWALSGLGTVESSPALDCARDVAGAKLPGRPGVIYLGSNSGKLFSFIVDSRGIDTTAPWPKYQHDPRNTGNSSTPMAEFACPP
jgi:hypothetical protein